MDNNFLKIKTKMIKEHRKKSHFLQERKNKTGLTY